MLRHSRPDRIPVDFGATGFTGIHVSLLPALREHYGLEPRTPTMIEPFTMIGLVEDDLGEALGSDAAGVFPLEDMFGLADRDRKPYMFNGQEILVPGSFTTTVDENGSVFLYPCGDRDAAPSGKMHRGGFFFDQIIRQKHFDESNLDPRDNTEEFCPVTEAELQHLRHSAQRAQQTGRAVVLTVPGTNFGCTSLVPGPRLKDPRGIRDIVEWMVSTKIRRDYIHAVFARQADIALANLPRIFEAVGDVAQVALVDTNDFGAQLRPLYSLATYRELFAPYHARITAWIHEHTGWKTMKHSCGCSELFLDAFADAGFDIFNPVQCAAGMDPSHLKSKYGDRVVFWGGGVETQTLLNGTAAQVREEVLSRCRIFSDGGGFVFAGTHNIQPLTPVENIVAMVEAVRDFNDGV